MVFRPINHWCRQVTESVFGVIIGTQFFCLVTSRFFCLNNHESSFPFLKKIGHHTNGEKTEFSLNYWGHIGKSWGREGSVVGGRENILVAGGVVSSLTNLLALTQGPIFCPPEAKNGSLGPSSSAEANIEGGPGYQNFGQGALILI